MVGLQGTLKARVFDRDRSAWFADWVGIALAVSLPWSTSAVGILGALWLIAVIPALDVAVLRRSLSTPAGGLPIVFFLLGLIGLLWADASLDERWKGLGSFLKLLFIPLLIARFSQSERGPWVLIGFVASCAALLALSWVIVFSDDVMRLFSPDSARGVPVRDWIAQSGEFMVCIFVLAKLALDAWRERRRWHAIGSLLLAAALLLNILFVATTRTVVVVFPILLLLFAYRYFSRKAMIVALLAALASAALAWSFASPMRTRIVDLVSEIRNYGPDAPISNAGLRIEFWRKSVEFVAAAPVVGHGTGSIRELFRRAAAGHTGVGADPASNPHNQVFAVAIQLGFVGTAVLFAMWLAHLMLFRGESTLAWVGLVIVAQNVVSSMFNSHLFDFAHGWGYVIGVGVAAGMVLKKEAT